MATPLESSGVPPGPIPPAIGGYQPSDRFVKWFGKPAAPPPTQHTPPVHRGLGRSSYGVFILTTLIQVMGVISTAVVGHTFFHRIPSPGTPTGLTIWGEIVFFLLIASSINWLGDLRVGAAYTYYVSRGQPAKELTGTYLTLRVVLVSLIGLAALPATFVLGGALHFSYSSPTYQSFGLFLVLPVLWSPWMVVSQLRIARGSSIQAQYPQFVEVGVRTVAIISVIFLDPGLLGFTYAFVIGAAASFAYCIPELWREMSPPAQARAVQLLRYSWPLMGSLMFQFLASNAPPFFVTGLLHQSSLFAVFSWDNGWRILLLSVPSAVVLPLFPYLASFHARGDYALVQRKTWEALRFTALIVLPASIAIVVYRVPIPNVIVDGQVAQLGAITIALLAISAIPLGLSQVIGTALNSIGYQRLELYISGDDRRGYGCVDRGLVPVLSDPLGHRGRCPRRVVRGPGAECVLHGAASSRPDSGLAHRPDHGGGPRRVPHDVGVESVCQPKSLVDPVPLHPARLRRVLPSVLAGIGELTKADLLTITGAVGLPDRLGHMLGRLCWRAEPPP